MLSTLTLLHSKLNAAFDLPESRSGLRRAALKELEQRAYFGSFIYPSCWIGISFSSGIISVGDPVFWAIAAILTALATARVVLHLVFERLLDSDESLARRAFTSTVLATTLTYGTATLFTLVDPALRDMQYPMVISCAVIFSTATMMLAMDPILRYGIPTAMLSPIGLGTALSDGVDQTTLAILLLVNVVYLFFISHNSQRDYWEAMTVRERLRQQALDSERAAHTDALTGISNRLHFDKVAGRAWLEHQASAKVFSILLVDIDHFKHINDTFGHAAGDRCLVAVAKVLCCAVRHEGDIVARYGGEEFIALLCGGDNRDALLTAERLRSEVFALEIPIDEVRLKVTCSVGVATVMQICTTLESVIGRADNALYAAKSGGRNRVHCSST